MYAHIWTYIPIEGRNIIKGSLSLYSLIICSAKLFVNVYVFGWKSPYLNNVQKQRNYALFDY